MEFASREWAILPIQLGRFHLGYKPWSAMQFTMQFAMQFASFDLSILPIQQGRVQGGYNTRSDYSFMFASRDWAILHVRLII
jgi:hypothetical protein